MTFNFTFWKILIDKFTSSILEKLPPVYIHVDSLFSHFTSGLRRFARSSSVFSSGLVGAWRFSKEYQGHVHDNLPGFDILYSVCAGVLMESQYWEISMERNVFLCGLKLDKYSYCVLCREFLSNHLWGSCKSTYKKKKIWNCQKKSTLM